MDGIGGIRPGTLRPSGVSGTAYQITVTNNLDGTITLSLTSVITKLAITGSIAASTTFSTTSSGVSYTKSLDDGNLGASAAIFNTTDYAYIFLNGVYQDKGVNATWVSATSFRLDVPVDNGDEIIIIS